jgi:Tol biopolymer transport system component
MNKKLIIILALVGILGFFLIVRNLLTFNPILNKISEDKAFYPSLSSDENYIFFFDENQDSFYKISLESHKKEQISSGKLTYMESALWSPDRNSAIVVVSEYEKPENKGMSSMEEGAITRWLYDFKNNQKITQLPPEIGAVAWSPDSQKIAYTFLKQDGFYLNIANPDGSNSEEITALEAIYDPFLEWSPDGKKVAVCPPPQISLNINNIYVVDIETKEIKQLTSDGLSFGAEWLPDSQKILYTKIDEYTKKPSLWAMDADGNNKKDLKISAFTLHRAIWTSNSKKVICAYSEQLPENYLSKEAEIPDQFAIINIKSGKVKKISLPKDRKITTANYLMLSPDNKTLFFIDRDHYLYSLKFAK